MSGTFPISQQAAETFPISVKMDVPAAIPERGANQIQIKFKNNLGYIVEDALFPNWTVSRRRVYYKRLIIALNQLLLKFFFFFIKIYIFIYFAIMQP